MSRPTTRGARRFAGLLVAVATLAAGCASIPSGGSVHSATGSRSDQALQVRFSPPGPQPGSDQTQIVQGFLDSFQAYPISNAVAAQYLAPGSAAGWHPERATVVYDQETSHPAAPNHVLVQAHQVASLSPRGVYRTASGLVSVSDSTFTLRKVAGEWRIIDPPDIRFISADFFTRYYRPYSLYFVNRANDDLVADPIYLASGTGVAANLVHGLQKGPTSDLRGQAGTVLPTIDQASSAVAIRSDGVADVSFGPPEVGWSRSETDLASAQLVWTLGQVDGVTGVRLLQGDRAIVIPGLPAVQPLSSWEKYDPAGPSSRNQLFALLHGRLVAVNRDQVSPFKGLWGQSDEGIRQFDVQPGLGTLAAVTDGGTTLLSGPISATTDASASVLYKGGHDLIDPTWDRDGNLWVVDRTPSGAVLLMLHGHTVGSIALGPLAHRRILRFTMSPDEARIAVLVRPAGPIHPPTGQSVPPAAQILIARVNRTATGTVQGIGRIRPLTTAASIDFSNPLDIAWADPTDLVVLSTLGGLSPQPYTARIDGSSVTGGQFNGSSLLGRVGAVSVASSGTGDGVIYVGDRQGRWWFQGNDGAWTPVQTDVRADPLTDANFPG
ncbi:MAG: LpqB family beta-propeller domain-containing protein [Nocardioidaceae bacterium]